MTFKYMKAPSESVKLEDVKFPVLASYKLDGYRASYHDGQILSKNLKLFRNVHVNEVFSNRPALENLDGELIVGLPYGEDTIRRTNSGLTSTDGAPDVTWWVFDDFTAPKIGFKERYAAVSERAAGLPQVKVLPHKLVKSAAELLKLEEHALGKGYEGLMLRDPAGPYKFGRSTPKEGWLFKFKRFVDAEAVVLRVEEGSINGNEKKADGTRHALKAGMTPSGLIGTIIGMDLKTGREIRVAPGRLSHEERKLPCNFINKVFTYRSFPTGSVNAPRFPTFQTFRDVLIDL